MSRISYKKHMQEALAAQEGLKLKQGSVEEIIWDEDGHGLKVKGVRLGESKIPEAFARLGLTSAPLLP